VKLCGIKCLRPVPSQPLLHNQPTFRSPYARY
jgi:hypothetical protein